jgi:hypothetical protein
MDVQAVQSDDADPPSEIIGDLPQQEHLKRDVLALLECMLNAPPKANVYVYLVPERVLIQVCVPSNTKVKLLRIKSSFFINFYT